MKIFKTIQETTAYLQKLRAQKYSIGFVPTMGALHLGHVSLIERAKKENNMTVCSIFVNPTQFNDIKDLEKYPRTLETDIQKLEVATCDILFSPSVDEMYPQKDNTNISILSGIDLGYMETVMEGKFRANHFKGVATIVNKLFNIINPDVAYFGEKDFQQLAIISELVRKKKFPIQIIGCPTVRENDGLAMSSRNVHLSSKERKEATLISKTLFEAQKKTKEFTVNDLKKWIFINLQQSKMMGVEYVEIVDSQTILPVENWNDAQQIRVCVAVKLGKTRLIDNVALK